MFPASSHIIFHRYISWGASVPHRDCGETVKLFIVPHTHPPTVHGTNTVVVNMPHHHHDYSWYTKCNYIRTKQKNKNTINHYQKTKEQWSKTKNIITKLKKTIQHLGIVYFSKCFSCLHCAYLFRSNFHNPNHFLNHYWSKQYSSPWPKLDEPN